MTTVDPDALRRLLTETDALLLDFDGPVCSVFAGLSAPVVVDQLCVVLADGGYGDPPPDIERSADPFDVLKYAASFGDEEARFVNAAFTAHEVEALATAVPTIGAGEFIHAWSETGRPLAIVSNNSTMSVKAYLDLHCLHHYVTHISGRIGADPILLKPNPHLVKDALVTLDSLPHRSTLVGDSVTDVQAAHAAGVRAIGYANKHGKGSQLKEADADSLVTRIAQLTEALQLM